MGLKIRIKRIRGLTILFALYNFIYAFYMGGYIGRNIYLGTLALYIFSVCIYIVVSNAGKIRFSQLSFWNETKLVLGIAGVFLIVTVIQQIINRNIQLFFLERLLYLILPIIIVFCIANEGQEDLNIFVYIFLCRMILQFLLINFQHLSLENILSISWMDSDSSVYESSQAHELFIMTVLLLCIHKKKLAIFSTILCLFNFKRVSFILCLVAWGLVPQLKKRRVPQWLLNVCWFGMLVSPFLMQWIYSYEGADFFYRLFGINLDYFAKSRLTLVRQTLDYFNGHYNGYGTIRNYFKHYSSWYAHVGTMHCDILVIYFECTILGVLVYVSNLIKIAYKDCRAFFILLYMFLEVIVSQYIEAVPAWTLFFFAVFYLQKYDGTKKRKIRTGALE